MQTLKEQIGEEKFNTAVKYFGYLYDRWQDEKNYEDFEDYVYSFADATGFHVVEFKKRPFRCVFKLTADSETEFYIRCTAKYIFAGVWEEGGTINDERKA